MKPTITKLKDVRGRITGYRAALGSVEADGTTPALAGEACEAATLDALQRLDNGTDVHEWRGHHYIVAPTTHGWSYWLDTFSSDFFMGPYPRHEEANGAALHHLAQHVWDHDVADDAAFTGDLPPKVRSEIRGWIRFQRAYKRIAAEGGRTDNEVHRLACESSYESAPTARSENMVAACDREATIKRDGKGAS